MSYRKISTQELEEVQQNAERLLAWNTYRTWILQCYGEQAHSFDVEVRGESDDEGGSWYSVGNISVADKDGKYLEYDLSLPYFTERILPGVFEDLEDDAYYEHEDYHNEDGSWAMDSVAETLKLINTIQEDYAYPKDSTSYIFWADFPQSREYDAIGGSFLVNESPCNVVELFVKE